MTGPASQSGSGGDLLRAICQDIPYIRFLGLRFDRHGDELTALLPFHRKLVGNPDPAALHGGVTAAFLEVTALVELHWTMCRNDKSVTAGIGQLPRTISFSIDYLRPGLPKDSFAQARVNRAGRRFASVHVEGWQERRTRLFAQATGHFLMPERHD